MTFGLHRYVLAIWAEDFFFFLHGFADAVLVWTNVVSNKKITALRLRTKWNVALSIRTHVCQRLKKTKEFLLLGSIYYWANKTRFIGSAEWRVCGFLSQLCCYNMLFFSLFFFFKANKTLFIGSARPESTVSSIIRAVASWLCASFIYGWHTCTCYMHAFLCSLRHVRNDICECGGGGEGEGSRCM